MKITRSVLIEGEYIGGEIVDKVFKPSWIHEGKEFNRNELRAFAAEINAVADELNRNCDPNSLTRNIASIEKFKHE